LDKKPAKKSPAPPFTTSTLQQEASRKLYFSVSKTMNMAQRLYEAGLITYMRTDSVNLSDEARKSASKEINSAFGENYSSPRNFKGNLKVHKKLMKLFVLRILHYIQLMLIVIKQGFMN
jgi:DNA topoisomerase-1